MPNGYLTTHVLDTATGLPAANLKIVLLKCDGDDETVLATLHTNSDGRTDTPILPKDEFETGTYKLLFHAGDYLRASNIDQKEPFFIDVIPIAFGMNDPDAHYHVPLLLSPYGYSTYRGS